MYRSPLSRGLLCLLLGGMALRPSAEPVQGDLNSDTVLDSADVVTLGARIHFSGLTPQEALALDFDRSGVLDKDDLRFLSGIILGQHGFLPNFSLSEETRREVIVTREASYPYTITVSDAVGDFTVRLGDQLLLAGTGAGEAAALFSLVEGVNLFTLVFEDSGGHRVERQLEIRRDSVPPLVSIESPAEGTQVNQLDVLVKGQALDGQTPASVTVNGVAMTSKPDGSFEGLAPFALDLGGVRQLRAIATDAAGNTAEAFRRFELFVTPPETFETGTARLDLPAGAISRRGETAGVDDANNAEIKSVLGPGADLVVATMPPGGFTDGVIIMPDAVMVSVETGNAPESGLVGDPPTALFTEKPGISIANGGGAGGATPLWIFQIIPDSDGDGHPELSLVARGKIEDSGPNAGRIVPVEPVPGDGFIGTFNPNVPTFNNGNLTQVAGIGAVQRLQHRLKQRTTNDAATPQARVTFYCCAASAVIPHKGKVRCNTSGLPFVQSRLQQLKAELLNLRGQVQQNVAETLQAHDARIDAVSQIGGTVDIPGPGGTTITVPTLLNGKAFACLKNFVPGSAALNKLNDIGFVIGELDTLKSQIEAGLDPPPVTAERLADVVLSAAGNRLDAAVDNASQAAFDAAGTKLEKLKRYKGIVDKLGALNDCAQLIARINTVQSSWTTITFSEDEREGLLNVLSQDTALYKRYSDCYRQLVAERTQSGMGAAAVPERWLPIPANAAGITERITGLAQFSGEALANDNGLNSAIDLTADALIAGTPGKNDQLALVAGVRGFLDESRNLINRQQEALDGFDAILETSTLAPLFKGRAETDLAEAIASIDKAIANESTIPGAHITTEPGTPFATMTDNDGSFVHYVFSSLSIVEGDPRLAVFEDRPYAMDATAGFLAGERAGNTGRFEFPFTPLSTVDFNAFVDIGDIVVGSTVQDTGSQAPSVAISRPTDGSAVIANRGLRIETNATDDFGVLGVEITLDGASVLGLPGGAAKGIIANVGGPGPHVITATAVDGAGLTGTTSITVTAVDSSVGLKITPAEARVGLGETLQFTATIFGQPTDSVSWKINGFTGVDSPQLGSVSPTGLYSTASITDGPPGEYLVYLTAEVDDFPDVTAKAIIHVIDTRFVMSRAVTFTFPAATAPGGGVASRPVTFLFESPLAPAGKTVSRPVTFTYQP